MGSSSSRPSSSHTTYPGQRSSISHPPHARPTASSTTNTTTPSRPSRTARPTQRTSTSISSNSNTASAITRPGAYAVSHTPSSNNGSGGGGGNSIFRVTIPPNVSPNQEFQVYAGSRIVRVRCPPNTRPGQMVQITVPNSNGTGRQVIEQRGEGMMLPAVLTSAEGDGGGGAVRMNSDARLFNNTQNNNNEDDASSGTNNNNNTTTSPLRRPTSNNTNNNNNNTTTPPPQPRAYNVVVPPNARPGSTFPVNVNGTTIQVSCPQNARPGNTVRIVPPAHLFTNNNNNNNNNNTNQNPTSMQSATDLTRPPDSTPNSQQERNDVRTETTNQMFEVIVPQGVRPNQPFPLIAGGQRVLVNCPPNARSGQRIRFSLPITRQIGGNGNNNNNNSINSSNSNTTTSSNGTQQIDNVQLKYDTKDGWMRNVRVDNNKFQWVRLDTTNSEGDIMTPEQMSTFSSDYSGFVRHIQFMKGNDERMRTGIVTFLPAQEALVPSTVINEFAILPSTASVVPPGELAMVQRRSFEKKTEWFQNVCKHKLQIPWNDGHFRIVVRRQHLLSDSIASVMSLSREDLRKIWRFEFMNEEGIDAGGLAKEWFLLVTERIFDADSGLWLSAAGNQGCMKINPGSEISCPDDHLIYFRFLGRVLGKALFSGQIVSGHMVRYIYKHMLGWPITFSDLETVDGEMYSNLKKLENMDKDQISYMCLDFTVTEERMGEKKVIELIPKGSDKEVNGDNLSQYLEAYLKYIMLDKVRPQITELLLGFYDVIPETLLTVFDFQELELIMCGLPQIDLDDWKMHTLYTGLFSEIGGNNEVCKWFWEVVRNDFDEEMRARLLQFVTATSSVPSRGFSVLQGSDGNIKKFTINGVALKAGAFPRSHTCFNRIDLPRYKSKKELREKLKIAVTTCATGFTIE